MLYFLIMKIIISFYIIHAIISLLVEFVDILNSPRQTKTPNERNDQVDFRSSLQNVKL